MGAAAVAVYFITGKKFYCAIIKYKYILFSSFFFFFVIFMTFMMAFGDQFLSETMVSRLRIVCEIIESADKRARVVYKSGARETGGQRGGSNIYYSQAMNFQLCRQCTTTTTTIQGKVYFQVQKL